MIRDDSGRVRSAHELKNGGEYAVIVSTGGGLLRYRLGDRIRVDGRYLDGFRVAI